MQVYVAKRLLLAVPTLAVIALVLFAVIRMVPGDAATMLLADASFGATPSEAAEVLREKLGLNRPLHEAFASWAWNVLRGDLGESLRTGEPVGPELLRRLPLTFELTVLSMLIALVIGIPGGILSAVKSDSIPDYIARFLSVGALSIPNFWLGVLLILIPFQLWGHTPPLNYVGLTQDPWANLTTLFFPALALGTGLSAAILRMTRTNLLEVIRQDYIRTARAKGLAERPVILGHAMKNAMIPTVEIIISQFGRLLSGVVIIEVVFALPGMGRAIVDAIFWRDYVTLQGFVLFMAATVLLLNIVADVVYGWLDPRIRYG